MTALNKRRRENEKKNTKNNTQQNIGAVAGCRFEIVKYQQHFCSNRSSAYRFYIDVIAYGRLIKFNLYFTSVLSENNNNKQRIGSHGVSDGQR